MFLYDTGIRAPGELRNIKVSDLQNNGKELAIRDEISKTFGRRIKLMLSAKIRKLEVIPNCGHQFIGETNGKIMSKAPLWAFAGDTTFPSPDGGKRLY